MSADRTDRERNKKPVFIRHSADSEDRSHRLTINSNYFHGRRGQNDGEQDREMANPAISLVLKKLDELLSKEINLLIQVKPQFESLQRELRLIKASLAEFDWNRATKVSPPVEEIVQQLRGAAFVAENIVDDFYLAIDQKRRSGFRGSLTSCLICVRETPARHELGTRIEEVQTRIRQIYDRMITLQKSISTAASLNASSSAARGPSELEKAALSSGLRVVGFEKDEKAMTEQLLSGEGGRVVISVLGMGGIGKTTIAKKIYRSDAVDGHFTFTAWVTVSRLYSATDLLRSALSGILDCIPGTRKEKQEVGDMKDEQLVEKLRDRLGKERYLVVLDDIWEKGGWDLMNYALPASPGSRVVLTTRKEDVANYAQGKVYKLPFLSNDESWELFCGKVFPGAGCPPELEEVGRKMVSKCRGLPLAIIVLGGLLIEREQRRPDWSVLCERLTQELSADRNEMIKNILALSYDDLSTDLKICFLYMGLFPEDMEIDAAKLTQLWVAEGFIAPAITSQTPEEAAEQHLEKLACRSVLQVVDRDSMGRVDKCRIHDLLLDLAKTEGEKNQFLDVHGRLSPAHGVKSRRLAIHENASACFSSTNSGCLATNLHSLLCFNLHGQMVIANSFVRLKLLRVIDLEGAAIEILPEEIGNMVHLTYLGLRRTKLASLPSSVGNLGKLQTLDVRDVRGITLPKGLWRARTLRHLHAHRVQPHASCGALTELQTLHSAAAGAWVEASLEKFTSLRKLSIEDISESHVKALSTAVGRLNRLNILKLEGSWVPDVFGLALTDHEGLHQLLLKGSMRKVFGLVAGNLPKNVTVITLEGCGLQQDPLALLEGLIFLRNLRLFRGAFVGQEMVSSAAGFPRLRELYICELSGLQRLRLAEGAMVSLESFSISGCNLLESLPEGLRGMRALKELKLERMPPTFTERAEENGDDWYKIRHIPAVKVF